MNIFIYDNTFEGFLSAVFYAYESKIEPDKIIGNNVLQEDLFAQKYFIENNTENAKRVWKGICEKQSGLIGQKVHRVFLSELPGIEMLLLKFIRLCFDTGVNVHSDFSNDIVLEMDGVHKRVAREAHRVVMFIRFRKMADGIYFAPFEPAYNVLPMATNHLKDRFSDMPWVVYDTRRNYGYYYNLKTVSRITINNQKFNKVSGKVNKDMLDETEMEFQALWRQYFDSINIKERKNPKVHQQFLPKRFWKFLPEKNFIKPVME